MSQAAVVYWSGTGHTEAMAQAVAAAAQADLFTAAEFDADKAARYAAIAFGCPSMGAEQLEESEFEPMFDACGQEDCALRFLRLGRRRMDAHLGGRLRGSRSHPLRRERHLSG